jgi:CRISPR/Cas system-associated exonuclease Cas4 (RecB family)
MSIESVREKRNSLFEQLIESEGSSLAPSRIASQFYCEKKVDLTREHGDIETPAKTRGSETHEKAAEDSEEISDDEFWEALEKGERQIIVESPFIGEAADFLIGGIPDAVLFDDGKPQLIFERKTTSRPDYLYKNQRIQAWLYGFILDSLGFETDELEISILSHEQSLDPDTGKELQQLVIASYEGWGIGEHELTESPKAILHLSEFSKVEYLEDLNWALGYWRNDREPIPTKKAAKCRACEYNDVCPDSHV